MYQPICLVSIAILCFTSLIYFWLIFPPLLSATGWQAWPALEAAAGSGHKRNRYKKVAAPLSRAGPGYNVAATLQSRNCPTVNNALGSLVYGGVAGLGRTEQFLSFFCKKEMGLKDSKKRFRRRCYLLKFVQLSVMSMLCSSLFSSSAKI